MIKERKVRASKSRIHFDKIINLLKNKTPYATIGRRVGLCKEYISAIAKENGLNYKVTRGDSKRRKKIQDLISKGVTYELIATKFGISKQRVSQYAKAIGVSRHVQTRERNKKLLAEVKNDIKEGLNFNQIKDKHQLTQTDFNNLYSLGLSSLPGYFRNKRNEYIVEAFSNGRTAQSLLDSDESELGLISKLTNINRIYAITTQAGVRRQPKVKSRNLGGSSEKKKVMKFIRKKREKDGLTFGEITRLLNKKGLKTISGKEFKEANVTVKYKQIQKQK